MDQQDDKEHVEAAAREYVRDGNCYVMDTYDAHEETFKEAVAWRDKNPSPEVLALAEALVNIARQYADMSNGDIRDKYHEAVNAIAAYKAKVLKGER